MAKQSGFSIRNLPVLTYLFLIPEPETRKPAFAAMEIRLQPKVWTPTVLVNIKT